MLFSHFWANTVHLSEKNIKLRLKFTFLTLANGWGDKMYGPRIMFILENVSILTYRDIIGHCWGYFYAYKIEGLTEKVYCDV